MLRGLWGRQSANKRPYICCEWTFALFGGFPPTPHCHPAPPPGCGWKCGSRERWYILKVTFFRTSACSEAENRHKLTFFEGYLTLNLDSAELSVEYVFFADFLHLRTFWEISLWKMCGQIRPRSWGLGLKLIWWSFHHAAASQKVVLFRGIFLALKMLQNH